MYKHIVRDKYKRLLFLKIEYIRCFQRYILKTNVDVAAKYLFNFKYQKLTQGFCYIFKNRCVVSARGRATLRFCKLSRIKFKELSNTAFCLEYRNLLDNMCLMTV